MSPQLSKVLSLICFVLCIGLFLSYRTGGFDRLLSPPHAAQPILLTDTLPQAYKDSLALDYLVDSLTPGTRLSTSKSMVLMKVPNPALREKLKGDTIRLRNLWWRHEKMLLKKDSVTRAYNRYYDSVAKSRRP